MLADVKTALRVSHDALDGEISDLIDAARQDLMLSGISSEKAEVTTDIDPLIKRAIVTYCKANFGYDNPEAERFQRSYDMIKQHLCLSVDYLASDINETQ